MTLKLRHDSSGYLTCEHVSVFYLLMLNSGIMGAYTYVVRGGVFCLSLIHIFLPVLEPYDANLPYSPSRLIRIP